LEMFVTISQSDSVVTNAEILGMFRILGFWRGDDWL
jgi:hypothetical protein